jgi:hypothetical protein
MEIRKKEFEWARPLVPLERSNITALALHHMEHMTAGMDEIHQWHLNRGWKGFAYNYWIDYGGNVWECRGLNKGGALEAPHNEYALSIGFQGDYDLTVNMPGKQFIAGVELTHYLKKLLPTLNLVEGHKHWQEKTCPGEHFPMEEMIKMADMLENIRDYDEIASWAKQAVLNVIESGIMIGTEEGYFKPAEYITRQEVAVVIDRLMRVVLDTIGNNSNKEE